MENLKYWGWPIPEYTPIAKIILLFTDPREVYPLVWRIHSIQASSAVASVEAVLDNNHTLGFTLIHMC